jgi:radical SAM protein with 4Fe4S-binding SPASM domain
MTTSNTLNTRIDLKDAIPLKVPLNVYLDITDKCNFTCSWCPTGSQNYPDVGSGSMSYELFEKIINDFEYLVKRAKKKIKSLNFFWMGEPLLNKEIYKMISLAKKKNIAERILLTTNGSLLNSENSEKLVESGVDLVSISFYGLSNQDYLKVHKTIGFEKIVQNSRSLLEIREKKNSPTPIVAAKFFEKNNELEKLLTQELRCVDLVAFESPFNWSEEYSKLSGQEVEIASPGPMEVCPSPWFVMSIGWEGHVGVCCADWHYDINVGNLMEETVYDIWNGTKIIEFRKLIAEKRYNMSRACRGCSYFKVSHDEATNIDDLIKNDIGKALSLSK